MRVSSSPVGGKSSWLPSWLQSFMSRGDTNAHIILPPHHSMRTPGVGFLHSFLLPFFKKHVAVKSSRLPFLVLLFL